MKKVSYKIIIIFIVSSLLISAAVGTTSIIHSTNIVNSESQDKIDYLLKQQTVQIESELKNVEASAATLTATVSASIQMDIIKNETYLTEYDAFINPVIKALVENNPSVISAYVVLDPFLGEHEHGGWWMDPKDDKNVAQQPLIAAGSYSLTNPDFDWYYYPLRERVGIWNDPGLNEQAGIQTIAYTMPIVKENQALGVVGLELSWEQFSALVSNIEIYDTGEGLLLNKNSDILVSQSLAAQSNLSQVNNGKYLIEKMWKEPTGLIDWTSGEEKRVVGYSKLSNGMILAVQVLEKEIQATVNGLKIVLVAIVLAGMAVSIVVAFIMSRSISRPILKVTEMMEKTAHLDLSAGNFGYLLKKKDETGKMANALEATRQALHQMVQTLLGLSATVDGNAQKVENLVNAIRTSTLEASATAEQLQAGMEESAASTEEINSAIWEINNMMKTMEEDAEKGTALTLEISNRANELRHRSGEAGKETAVIYAQVKEEVEAAVAQAQAVSQINNMAEVILGITSQTGLLALNAAIEAARAGEAGRGFSVVADEIKKLAEQSSQTASGIQQLVREVNDSVANLSKTSLHILNFIDKKVNEDYKQFSYVGEQYYSDAEKVSSLINDFSAYSQKLSQSVTGVAAAVNDIAATVSEGAGGSEKMAGKVQAIEREIDQIVSSTDENRKGLNELQVILTQFKL